jgi:hypothetical protein
MKTTTADNILFSIVTIAGMYGCLYILLATISLIDLFFKI